LRFFNAYVVFIYKVNILFSYDCLNLMIIQLLFLQYVFIKKLALWLNIQMVKCYIKTILFFTFIMFFSCLYIYWNMIYLILCFLFLRHSIHILEILSFIIKLFKFICFQKFFLIFLNIKKFFPWLSSFWPLGNLIITI
jgi:hypothetical protein